MHSDWNDLLVHYAFNTGEVEGELGWPKRVPEEGNNMRSIEFEKGNLLQVKVFEEWRGIQKEVRDCDPKPVCAEGEEWSDDEWRCVNSCGVGYIRKNGRCMKDFLGGSVHPLANDSTCNGFSVTSGFNPSRVLEGIPIVGHDGVDLAKYGGCNINNIAAGIVAYVGWDPSGGGYMSSINHHNGFYSWYLHGTGTYYVSAGQTLTSPQEIMQMGATGLATGTHLHLTLRENGISVDSQLIKYLGDLSVLGNLFIKTKKY